jgi:hypothetical protein
MSGRLDTKGSLCSPSAPISTQSEVTQTPLARSPGFTSDGTAHGAHTFFQAWPHQQGWALCTPTLCFIPPETQVRHEGHMIGGEAPRGNRDIPHAVLPRGHHRRTLGLEATPHKHIVQCRPLPKRAVVSQRLAGAGVHEGAVQAHGRDVRGIRALGQGDGPPPGTPPLDLSLPGPFCVSGTLEVGPLC